MGELLVYQRVTNFYRQQVDRLEAKAAKEEPLEENPLGILTGSSRSTQIRSNTTKEQQGNGFFEHQKWRVVFFGR